MHNPLVDVRFIKDSKYPIDLRTPDGQLGLSLEEADQLIDDLVKAVAEAHKNKYYEEFAELVPVKYPTIFLRKVA